MLRVVSWAPTSLIKGARSLLWVLLHVGSLYCVDEGESELSFSASLVQGPISVDPNTQATGVGRALMQAVIGTYVLHNTHDTTRHDTTRHDTTRHDTTRHDTTNDTTRHDTH
jgi:outer membrane scaffolding protein for murein synthesis (MipA/OmpV family)